MPIELALDLIKFADPDLAVVDRINPKHRGGESILYPGSYPSQYGNIPILVKVPKLNAEGGGINSIDLEIAFINYVQNYSPNLRKLIVPAVTFPDKHEIMMLDMVEVGFHEASKYFDTLSDLEKRLFFVQLMSTSFQFLFHVNSDYNIGDILGFNFKGIWVKPGGRGFDFRFSDFGHAHNRSTEPNAVENTLRDLFIYDKIKDELDPKSLLFRFKFIDVDLDSNKVTIHDELLANYRSSRISISEIFTDILSGKVDSLSPEKKRDFLLFLWDFFTRLNIPFELKTFAAKNYKSLPEIALLYEEYLRKLT